MEVKPLALIFLNVSIMRIVKLHQYPCLMEECCSLLNQEWPRSKTARIHSLSKSSDSFPMCLCFLDDDDNDGDNSNDNVTAQGVTNGYSKRRTGKLIGHVKVSRGSLDGEAYIESLIISKSQRGQGLGRQFMLSLEKLLQSNGFTRVTLHTIDASAFYSKLGYSVVKTIEAFGPASSSFNQTVTVKKSLQSNQSTTSNSLLPCFPNSPSSLPSPPPPPPSKSIFRPVIKLEKIVMVKKLS